MFFTATALLGFQDLTDHFHYEMCHIMEMADYYKRLLIWVPRNHYKSSIGTITYPAWRGLRNPSETGLVVANTATNSEHFVGQIASAYEKNQFLREWFPELKPELSKRWNAKEKCLPRPRDWPEATWETAGWNTKVTSRHYDYIIFDDIVDEETYQSIELMAKLIERFEQRIKGCLKPPVHDRVVIVVMNSWSSIDLAQHIVENHPEFHVYYRQAIIDTPEGKKALFPEKWPLERLLKLQEQDPYTFACQFMNNPVDPNIMENKVEWLTEYGRLEDGLSVPLETPEDGYDEVPFGYLNIYATGDPRHTLSTKPGDKLTSRNAITITGVDHRGRRYLLDEYAARSSPEEFLRAMMEMHRKWRPLRFGIEGYGYQKALAPLASLIWKNEVSKPILEPMEKDTKQSKETKIRGGVRFFKEGKAFTHRTMSLFKDEFITFPGGRTRDLLDCWAMAQELMRPPMADEEQVDESIADEEYFDSLRSQGKI